MCLQLVAGNFVYKERWVRMNMRGFMVTLILGVMSLSATAESATPTSTSDAQVLPGSSPVNHSAVSGTESPPPPNSNGPIVVTLPNSIKIETTGTPTNSGLLTLIGVLVTAAVSVLLGYKTANITDKGRIETRELAAKERETKVLLEEQALAERQRQFDADQAQKEQQTGASLKIAREAETNKATIEGRRIALEMKRFGLEEGTTDYEAYLAATRFVHEQQVAEAQLIHSFSDKLFSENQEERSFAVFVLSAYVNPEVMGRIASCGETVVSNDTLKMLAAINGYEIAAVAKAILERRQAGEASKVGSPGNESSRGAPPATIPVLKV